MESRTICFASAKGGSGKTTIAASIAQILTTLGSTVLLVDTDAATNGLTLMYLREVKIARDRHLAKGLIPSGVFENELGTSFQGILTELPNGVHLIPATYSLKDTEKVSLEYFQKSLQIKLQLFSSEYDFILIDAQAGSDKFAAISIDENICDEVILVSEYDPLSAAGIERMKALFPTSLGFDRTWILLNKMLPKFISSFSEFLEVAKYLSPIPWNEEVVMSYSRRNLAINTSLINEFTYGVLQVLKTLLGDDGDGPVSNWIEDKKTILIEPLEQKVEGLKFEKYGLLKEKSMIEKKVKNKKVLIEAIHFMMAVVPALGIVVFFQFKKVSIPSSLINLLFAVTSIPLFLKMFFDGLKIKNDEAKLTDIEKRIETTNWRLSRLKNINNVDVPSLIRQNRSSARA